MFLSGTGLRAIITSWGAGLISCGLLSSSRGSGRHTLAKPMLLS